jgi:cytochrome c|tara:strand:+ start:595 stop:798 length:204 start_codon:yes stop_codon:yes gene_type:complete
MGIGGAPIMSDTEAWSDRIMRGIAMPKQNAVKGYIGSVGYMPPKGGRTDLSDTEVEAAVGYMVSQSE